MVRVTGRRQLMAASNKFREYDGYEGEFAYYFLCIQCLLSMAAGTSFMVFSFCLLWSLYFFLSCRRLVWTALPSDNYTKRLCSRSCGEGEDFNDFCCTARAGVCFAPVPAPHIQKRRGFQPSRKFTREILGSAYTHLLIRYWKRQSNNWDSRSIISNWETDNQQVKEKR